MKQQINFNYGTSNDYSKITPNEQSIYFLTDTNQLMFRGGDYSKGIEIVDSIPLEGEPGKIYLHNGELFTFSDTYYQLTRNNELEQLKTDIEELLRGI